MLLLEHITVQFGERQLFRDVNVTIGPHDRIGLVGSNGSGKSTLLKIIAGIQLSDGGNLNKAHYVTVGYLPQDGITARGRSLYEEAETAFDNVLELQHKLDEVQHRLSTPDSSNGEYRRYA